MQKFKNTVGFSELGVPSEKTAAAPAAWEFLVEHLYFEKGVPSTQNHPQKGDAEKMTDAELLTKFEEAFKKLKRNRENVPFEQLMTQYAGPYKALLSKVTAGADWFASRYIEELAFPRHPQDTEGNAWLDNRIEAILQDEHRPGGKVERYRAALIDRLDEDEYYQLVYEIYDRLYREAFTPYWQRHCHRLEDGVIYNDIFNKIWWPKEDGAPGNGCWVTRDYTGHDIRYPPHLKEEIQ